MHNGLIKEKLHNYNRYYSHPSYSMEKKLISEIRSGMLDEALASLDALNTLEKSRLAYDSIRSLKNSQIASCTLFSRAAIEGGVDPEDAFSLSDSFIKKIETLNKEMDLMQLECSMVTEFVRLVKQTKIRKYTRPVAKVVSYINEHTSAKLCVRSLAEVAHLSPDHLSKVFFDEVGVHLTYYIQQRKIEVSKVFLAHSDMKISDIAAILEFCNAAYFSSVFKKHTGTSAIEYRKHLSQN